MNIPGLPLPRHPRLVGEHALVWLEPAGMAGDATPTPAVRATLVASRTRRGPIRQREVSGTLAGYATLTDEARPVWARLFARRAFILADADAPDAVCPRTVAPGVWGEAPASIARPATLPMAD